MGTQGFEPWTYRLKVGTQPPVTIGLGWLYPTGVVYCDVPVMIG